MKAPRDNKRPNSSRCIDVFGRDFNSDEVMTHANALLTVMEQVVQAQLFLVGYRATPADMRPKADLGECPQKGLSIVVAALPAFHFPCSSRKSIARIGTWLCVQIPVATARFTFEVPDCPAGIFVLSRPPEAALATSLLLVF